MKSPIIDKESFYNNVFTWYKIHGRKYLPWRLEETNIEQRAYKVYVSEIMLQQTQVQRVLEHFYFQFLEKFPNLKSLAYALEKDILIAWHGLGYYNRARNMHKTAQICLMQHNATLPQNLNALKALPGIGKYTAGAIYCFGFLKNTYFFDGNIKRLLCRLFALENPQEKELESLCAELSHRDSFTYHQSLLDIGALICTAKKPKCAICPLYSLCAGKNNPMLYPQKKKIPNHKTTLALGVIIVKDSVFLVQSQRKLYLGLYNFLEIPHPHSIHALIYQDHFKHKYTNYSLHINIYKAYFKNIYEIPQNLYKIITVQNAQLYQISSLHTLPFSTLASKAFHVLTHEI